MTSQEFKNAPPTDEEINAIDLSASEEMAKLNDKGKLLCYSAFRAGAKWLKQTAFVATAINEKIEREKQKTCEHPRSHRMYIGNNMLRCDVCKFEFK